jgi:hypothetical protein
VTDDEFLRRRGEQITTEQTEENLQALVGHLGGETPIAFSVTILPGPSLTPERAREVLHEMVVAHPGGIPPEVQNLKDRIIDIAFPGLFDPS